MNISSQKFLCQYAYIPWSLKVSIGRKFMADPVDILRIFQVFDLFAGAVQFKKEAGLSYLRYHFLVAGGIFVCIGLLVLVVKCACFRTPIPDDDYEGCEDDFPLSPYGEKPQNGSSPNVLDPTDDDHNHQREKSTPSKPIPMTTLTPLKNNAVDDHDESANGKSSPAGT